MAILPVFLLFIVSCFAAEDVIQTNYGPVRGVVYQNYRMWQGVPYATPPLGKLRYKNPIPPSPWTQVKDCTNFTIGCAQNAHSMDVPKNTSEDCLYLEIWAPRVGKYSSPAAVMVFFYGGDFKEGGESFGLYNGSVIAGTTNTIVVITNYRVGNLGFFYNTAIGDPNVGLADQRWTLKWTQQNIAAFGGDPKLITIFGQSAGGESVTIHMASPKASGGLFQRAISESGPMSLNFKEPWLATVLAEVFCFELGCGCSDRACIEGKTTKQILQAADKALVIPLDFSEAIMKWAPVVTNDDNFPQQPLAAFEKGEIIKVPLISGGNLNDGVLFGWAISPNGPLPTYEYVAIVAGIFHDGWIEDVLSYYPSQTDNRAILSELLTDYAFQCAARRTLQLSTAAGIPQSYLYQFSQQPEFCPWPPSQKFCCNKVCHGDELAYIYQDSGAPFPWNMSSTDLYVSNAILTYWTSMARYGDPNKATSKYAYWPPFTTSNNVTMNIKYPLAPTPNLNAKKCDFLDQVGYYHASRIPTVLAQYKAGTLKGLKRDPIVQ